MEIMNKFARNAPPKRSGSLLEGYFRKLSKKIVLSGERDTDSGAIAYPQGCRCVPQQAFKPCSDNRFFV